MLFRSRSITFDTDPVNKILGLNISGSMLLSCLKKCRLDQLLRIGKQTIVSIPNFGYWKVRLHLLFKGTMPVTKNLPNEWYNTPNLHMCTIQDFVNFCNKKSIKIDKSMCLTNEKISEITRGNMQYKNIFSQLGIFLIQ